MGGLGKSSPYLRMREYVAWDVRFRNVVQFRELHGRLPTQDDDLRLFRWLKNQWYAYRVNRLSDEQRVLMESAGLQPTELGKAERWMLNRNKVLAFCQEHQRFPTREEDYYLHEWLIRQLSMMRSGELAPDRTDLMADIAAFRDKKQRLVQPWEYWLQQCLDFKQIHGYFPSMSQEPQLANWLAHQRVYARAGNLPSDRLQMLSDAGVPLFQDRKAPQRSEPMPWMDTFQVVLEFRDRHGRLPTMSEDKRLADWLAQQRMRIKKGRLPNDKKQLFLDAGLFDVKRPCLNKGCSPAGTAAQTKSDMHADREEGTRS